ncbi:hypothetical protein DM01DRAFT_95034 [Hesseltinella vesiculosa]|uniref:Uncharacterized protein n=1 Tax=Hesseltinella vesiculosa TaxID=101127 RepID=A0A1X2GB24_9FUNG|nr:hypothetical protein DM01DRAFT_95034 [Hesseltinella vesiculosa]
MIPPPLPPLCPWSRYLFFFFFSYLIRPPPGRLSYRLGSSPSLDRPAFALVSFYLFFFFTFSHNHISSLSFSYTYSLPGTVYFSLELPALSFSPVSIFFPTLFPLSLKRHGCQFGTI